MNVLITGCSGFVGSHLVEKLLAQDYKPKCLVRKTSNLRWIKHLPLQLVYGDVTDFESLLSAVDGVDYVFHLGGVVRAKKLETFYSVNRDGTRNLLEACKQKNPTLKRFIYISSQAAVGPSRDGIPLTENDTPRPISHYGKSKLQAEQVVIGYQDIFPVTIVRPPAVYGPRDDDFLTIFKYVKAGIKPLIGKDDKMLSIVYINDLLTGIMLAAQDEKAVNETFFIASKETCSWRILQNQIAQAMNKRAIFIKLPEFFLDFAATISEQLARIFNRVALLNRDKALEMKQRYWLIDTSKAEEKLGFKAEVNLETGIKKTYQWYREQGWL